MSVATPPTPLKSRLRSLAGQLSEAAKRPTAATLPHGMLHPDPEQPRKLFDQGAIEELAESIKSIGIIEPLVVRPISEGRYLIVCGERRWRAAKLAELRDVPVVIRELSDDEAFTQSLSENLDRENMAPVDEIRAIARLAGKTSVQDAARRLGKSAQWISKRKRIADAPDFVLAFVATGETGDIEALYELAKLADDEADLCRTLIAKHARGGHLRDEVKAAAKAAKDPQPDFSHPKDPPEGSPDRSTEPPSKDVGDKSRPKSRFFSVSAVEAVDDGTLRLLTDGGVITCELSPDARDQLRALIG